MVGDGGGTVVFIQGDGDIPRGTVGHPAGGRSTERPYVRPMGQRNSGDETAAMRRP